MVLYNWVDLNVFFKETLTMHMKADAKPVGPLDVDVTYILENPQELTGGDQREHHFKAAVGQNLLALAMQHGINIEHACGGVCACSTCHVHIDAGEEGLSEPEDEELDRVEEAPGNDITSRLSCQAVIETKDPITVRVPEWNRNAVKEVPH